MTDSGTNEAGESVEHTPGKRDRLVAAACELLYRQGIETTTLADIAQLADVPLGNVYYYFKTKDEIIDAVVQSHLHTIRARLATIEASHRTPKSRLKALVKMLAGERDLIAEYGCPQGSLCSEMNKRGSGSDRFAADLIRVPLTWVEDQFPPDGAPRRVRVGGDADRDVPGHRIVEQYAQRPHRDEPREPTARPVDRFVGAAINASAALDRLAPA